MALGAFHLDHFLTGDDSLNRGLQLSQFKGFQQFTLDGRAVIDHSADHRRLSVDPVALP
jgi:hypothetical protein